MKFKMMYLVNLILKTLQRYYTLRKEDLTKIIKN